MEGPHFFVGRDDHDGAEAIVRGDEAHHLARVLRARRGDPLTLADGTGALFQAHVLSVRQDLVRCRLAERVTVPVPRPSLTVIHALPKARKLDDVVQRLTELGVDRIVPTSSTRSQVRLDERKARKAHDRWRAIALAAAKQSRRARLPVIEPVRDWFDAFPGDLCGAVLSPDSTRPLRACIDPAADDVALAIGPEGGLTNEELDGCGLVPARLGPTVLRTETAALVACAAVLTLTGRIG